MKTYPIHNNFYNTKPSLPLSNKAIIAKVAAVTAATFLFFSLQLPVGIVLTCRIALAVSATTIISEKFIRPLNPYIKSIDWLNRDFDKDELKKTLTKHFVIVLVVNAIVFGFFIPPIQTAFGFHALGLQNLFKATVLAPIAEEILFRGFLQERIEDVYILMNAYVITIKTVDIKVISSLVTNLLFGAAHIVGNQVVPAASLYILCVTTQIGLSLSNLKEKENSLIPSVVAHMVQNAGNFSGLIIAKQISSFVTNLR